MCYEKRLGHKAKKSVSSRLIHVALLNYSISNYTDIRFRNGENSAMHHFINTVYSVSNYKDIIF